MKILRNILLAGLLFAWAGVLCRAAVPEDPAAVDDAALAGRVASLISSMTTEQKVAQLFVVRPEAVDSLDMGDHPVGGYCVFAQNFRDPASLDSLVRALNSQSFPPLLCIDEEGGSVARIGRNPKFGVPAFPSMKTVGRRGPQAVYEAGVAIGSYLRQYGFCVDFAPVADVDTNPDNPVIGRRAFSEDPEHAASLVVEFMRGLEKAGLASCLKHFPGHGDTAEDSHAGYAESRKSWEEMLSCEIIPFKAGIGAGVPMVMVGHISTPNVPEPSGQVLPATLSRMWITDKLRGELGFRGVVITDSMSMKAVSDRYDSGTAAVMALEAGVDIVLMPADLSAAYRGVLDAVRSGRLPQSRIDESLARILSLKLSLGLMK